MKPRHVELQEFQAQVIQTKCWHFRIMQHFQLAITDSN